MPHPRSGILPTGRPPPGTHQLLLALNHRQRSLVSTAVLSACVPVPWLLRKEVAFPSVEQPVLRAGRLTLDTALGSCRGDREDSAPDNRLGPSSGLKNPTQRPSAPSTCLTLVPSGDASGGCLPT